MKPATLILCVSLGVLIATGIHFFGQAVKLRGIEAEKRDPEIEEILKLQEATRTLLETYTALNANRNQLERDLAMTAAYAAHYMGTNGHSWVHASNKVWTAITTNAP